MTYIKATLNNSHIGCPEILERIQFSVYLCLTPGEIFFLQHFSRYIRFIFVYIICVVEKNCRKYEIREKC